MKIHESVESLMVGSVDNGIALGITTMLAETMGLYTCCIGAVRQNLQELSDLLNLPQYVVPMVGMCLGYAKEDLAGTGRGYDLADTQGLTNYQEGLKDLESDKARQIASDAQALLNLR
jgi:hypothetical protein